MSSKELVGEGPIFLTIKAVRGEPLMRELKENIQKMRDENIIRFLFDSNKFILKVSYFLGQILES